jgi:hypothetical protein
MAVLYFSLYVYPAVDSLVPNARKKNACKSVL